MIPCHTEDFTTLQSYQICWQLKASRTSTVAASEHPACRSVALVSPSPSECVTHGRSPAMLADADRNWERLCSVGMWGRWGERERMLWGNPSLCTNQHSRVRAHGQSCSEQTPPGALSVTATSRACLYESVRGAESTCTMFSVCHMCFIAFVFDSSCSWTWPGGRWLNCKPRL